MKADGAKERQKVLAHDNLVPAEVAKEREKGTWMQSVDNVK
jgi:hypothetical protein